MPTMRTPLPPVHLLTYARNAATCAQTLAHWARTDWPGTPRIHFDNAPENPAAPWGSPARGSRLVAAFAAMVRVVLAEAGAAEEWLLFLEDDLDFHPRLGSLVSAWGALHDPSCRMASLFNASVRPAPKYPPRPRAFAVEPASFQGAQAILLRRVGAKEALAEWDSTPGMTCQRMAKILGRERPIWVHQPSLVQHVAVDSGWGARVKRALDFDPGWVPAKTG